MVIKAVFFDFDGTISDAKGIAFRSLVRALKEFDCEVDERRLREVLGVKFERMLGMLGIRGGKVEKIGKKFYRYISEAAVAGGIRPCVSLKPLWKMREEGVPLFVVSNSRIGFLRTSIKTLGIEGLFRRVYDVEKFSSKDKALKVLFRKYGIKASEAVYVGDRFSDVEFARKAGCIAVAIHNKCSWSSLGRIERERPDFVVRNFYGLGRVVRGLNEKNNSRGFRG